MAKNLPAMQETRIQFLSQEEPLEKGMATHFSVLTWRIPWTEEPGRIQPTGLKRVRHMTEQLTLSLLLILTTTPQGRNSFLRIIIVL